MRIGIIGATGLVGQTMLQILAQSQLNITQLIACGSAKSIGKSLSFRNECLQVESIETLLSTPLDVVLMAAGSTVSLTYAPILANKGIFVIDNSSAWRMQEGIPLIVPEVNSHAILPSSYIIANPNCSTIQLSVVLAPLQKKYGLKRVIVSTYQAVSGTGQAALTQLMSERGKNGVLPEYIDESSPINTVYPYPIDLNVIPQCDEFVQDGYTREELKIINESRKILNLPNLNITATCVRVPVIVGHSEAVNVELSTSFNIEDIKNTLIQAPGILMIDEPASKTYPMPLPLRNQPTDTVLVGRVRPDFSAPNALNLWVVADNLRKGAALNAVQIVELLHTKGYF